MSESITDVCIAGGGPAGLAAALALQSQGFTVTVVDCATPPIDKACGEGLMPESIAALRHLGVEIDASAGQPFRGIRFSNGVSTVTGDFPNSHGMGVRRTYLHELLVRHAQEANVRLIWGAKSLLLCPEGLSIHNELLRARFIVGADGQKSLIRTSAHLDQVKSERRRYGFRRHYRMAPWSDYVELYWGPRGQAYVTPVAQDEVCVAFLSRDSKLRLDEALNDFPALQRRLAGAQHASHEMGAMSVSRQLRRVYKDGLALLGDASGSVDAITGEGLGLAFKQADALATALRSGDLRQYATRHREFAAKPRLLASLMLSMEWHTGLQRRVLAGLASRPWLFEALLKFHVGHSSPLDLCAWPSRHRKQAVQLS
jgi:2-polyprenyl-6-methoxyphenol hydroxylase-like FAD-dependent oxidoreductase